MKNDWALVKVANISISVRSTMHPDIFIQVLARALRARVSSVKMDHGLFVLNLIWSIRRQVGGRPVARIELSPGYESQWVYDIKHHKRFPWIDVTDNGKHYYSGVFFKFTGAINRRTRGYNLEGKKKKYNRGNPMRDRYSPLPDHAGDIKSASIKPKTQAELNAELARTNPDLVGFVVPKARPTHRRGRRER